MTHHQLTLPKSGSIRKIHHISDLHIRSVDSTKRYHEYSCVFNRFVKYIGDTNGDKDSVVVITGDIFHTKNKLCPTSIELFLSFIKDISDIMPIYIIIGNHDIRLDTCDIVPDMVNPLLTFSNDNVIYMNKCGYYCSSGCDVGFAVVPVEKMLDNGNTTGLTNDLPIFPPASGFPDWIRKKIVLSHASIPYNVSLEWFGEGYDYILLGDIHIQGVYNGLNEPINQDVNDDIYCISKSYSGDKALWGYAGSMIQQNFGEPVRGHGFITWNLDERSATCFNVRNEVGMINMINCEGEWILKATSDNKYIKVKDCRKYNWFPSRLNVRYILDGNKNIFQDCQDISKMLNEIGIQCESIKNGECNDVIDHTVGMDFRDINTPNSWVEYIELSESNRTAIPYSGWKKWFEDPCELLIKNDASYEPVLQNKIDEKNKKLQQEIDAYILTREKDGDKTNRNLRFDIVNISWNYILCYGCNCFLDFEKLKGNVVCINGTNGTGKTSMLETICVAIYGEGFGYRTNKDHQTSIICMQKPATSKSYTRISFRLNGENYTVTRNFSTMKTGKLAAKDVLLQKHHMENGIECLEDLLKGKVAVNAWVNKQIGNIESFLMSCMITQEFDMNFFDMPVQEQKAKIDSALSLQSISAFKKLIHEFSIAYKSLVKDFDAIQQSFIRKDEYHFNYENFDNSKNKIQKLQDEIKRLKMCVHNKRTILNNGNADYAIMATGKENISQKINQMYQCIRNMDADNQETEVDVELEKLIELRGSLQKMFDGLKEYYVTDVFIDINEKIDLPEMSLEVIDNELNVLETSGTIEQICKELDSLEFRLKKKLLEKEQIVEQWEMHLCCKPDGCIAGVLSEYDNDILYSYEERDAILKEYESIRHYESITLSSNFQDEVKEYNSWMAHCDNDIGINPSDPEFYVVYDMNVNSLKNNNDVMRDIDVKYNEFYRNKCDIESKRYDLLNKIEHYENKIKSTFWKYIEDYATVNDDMKHESNESIEMMKNKVELYDKEQIDIHTLEKDLEKVVNERGMCRDYEFNHECNACMNHPWRLNTIYLDNKIKDLEVGIVKRRMCLLSEKDYNRMKDAINMFEIRVEKTEYNMLQSELKNMQQELVKVEKELVKVEGNLCMLEKNRVENSNYIKSRTSKLEIMERYKRQYESIYIYMKNRIKLEKENADKLERFERVNAKYQRVLNYNQCVWLEQEKSLRSMMTSLDHDIEQCKQSILNQLMYDKKKKLMLDKEKWIRQKRVDAKICWDKLEACYKRIDTLRMIRDYDKNIIVYENALSMVDDYTSEMDISKKLEEYEQVYIDSKIEFDRLVDAEARHKRFKAEWDKLIASATVINDIHASITIIEEALTDYNMWVFKTKALPIVCSQVNSLLELICRNHRLLRLRCIFLDGSSKFNWFLQDGCNTVPFEKASGFQQFSVSLAMRIVMGKISGINSGHLFIDEGFSSFDSDNLANVPDFLKELLNKCGYNMIMIVSHLDELKDSCSRFISIERDNKRGISKLRL